MREWEGAGLQKIIKKMGLKPHPFRTAIHVKIRESVDFGEKPKKQSS